GDVDQSFDTYPPVAPAVIQLHPSWSNVGDGSDSAAVVAKWGPACPAEEDVRERRVLGTVGAVVDEEAHRPGRSRLVVVVGADQHDLSSGEVQSACVASRDQPGKGEIAHAEGGPPSIATPDLPARADRETVAGLEVRA